MALAHEAGESETREAESRGGARHGDPSHAEHTLQRTAKRFLAAPQARCPKCDSTYVGREPAFIHCRLCGKLARIADAPLELQELWEIRSGLRIAS